MSILVTGGLGYIGSHTVVQLIEANYDVVIIDNLSNASLDVLEKIEMITKIKPVFIKGDIRNEMLLNQVFNTYSIESVIHFAGLKAVGESNEMPLAYYDNNLSGTIKLLEVMKEHDVKKLVFSSSATVYGNNPVVPFHEEMALETTNPYGTTKRMIEEILQDLYKSDSSWSIVLLRYFNPIGAHESGLIGENPKGIPNNLLPYVAKVASGELEKLSVFGSDYPTIDGTGVRDYIHVDDLASGHIAAIKYIEDKSCIEAINLGTGQGYSVLQIINAFEKASQREIAYQIVDRRPGDIAICFADADKAKKLLNWQAERTLEEMCISAWRFTSREESL